jgi:hypothetical protein
VAEGSNDPAIYSVVNALRPGSPGPDSVIERPPACSACGRPFRDRVIRLHLLLDDWIPCDFVVVDDTYAVTPRVQSALLAIDVKGVAFQAMTLGRSEIFEMNDPEGEVALPELVQLSVIAEVDGPSGWWVREGTCDRCGRPIWGGGEDAGAALASSSRRPKGPPRKISRSAWHGEDMFWTVDPGPALITERVKAVLEKHDTPELILHPAIFV